MNIIQLVFFFLYTQKICAFELHESKEWKNLLHFDNAENEIMSPQWYLSQEKTAKSEYEIFLNAFNSDQPQSIFCEFPARFLYLKNSFAFKNLHNLDKCDDLNQFFKSFDKQNISVAITSEYYNAPSSAFGHIMFVLHNQLTPELDSKVIHFSALTRNDDFLHYSMNGLTGNYSGYFFQEPFFKKYNEYSKIEQRYIFIHPLKLTENQRRIFIYHLYELKKARFKYYFLAKNCGYQINKLLQIVYNKSESSPAVYFLPSEVLKVNKDFLEAAVILPPLSTKAKSAVKTLTKEEQAIFSKIIYNETDKPEIDNNLPNKLKKALVLYNQYQFRKKKNVLPNYTKIQSLTVSDLDAIEAENEKIYSPLLKPSPKRMSLRLTNNNKSANHSFYLNIRPVLVDLNDFQNHNLHESNFNLFNTELRYRDSNLQLEKLDLIDLKLISLSEKYFIEPSWFINSGLNRENNAGDISFSHSFGIGQSLDLIFSFSYFLGGSIDLIKFKKYDPSLLSYFNAIFYFREDYKFLYDGKLKFTKNETFYNHSFSVKRSFDKFNLSIGYIYAKESKEYLGLDYYF